jgi:ribosomal protein L35
MPKQKIKKSAATRFRITKTGKVLRRTQTMRHLRRKKSKKQIRSYKVPKQVTGKMAIKIKRMLGHA